LLEQFKKLLSDKSREELEARKRNLEARTELERQAANPPPGRMNLLPEIRIQPTTQEWFEAGWAHFEAIAAG
jgi:hypothetical protein